MPCRRLACVTCNPPEPPPHVCPSSPALDVEKIMAEAFNRGVLEPMTTGAVAMHSILRQYLTDKENRS